MQKTKTIDLNAPELKSNNPMPSSVCLSPQGALLIGTRGGEIMEVKGNAAPKVHLRAHFDSELWGLAMHPSKTEMITVGRDAMLAVWDIPNRKQLLHVKLEGPADAVAISNNGAHIAVGHISGKVVILDAQF